MLSPVGADTRPLDHRQRAAVRQDQNARGEAGVAKHRSAFICRADDTFSRGGHAVLRVQKNRTRRVYGLMWVVMAVASAMIRNASLRGCG